MGKRLTRREREKIKQKQITKSLKEARMKRGDEKQASNNHYEPIEKPIGITKEKRLNLENLTSNELEDFINEKCLHSRIYQKENIKASPTKFNYGDLYSDFGLKICFQNSKSQRQHYFGFELFQNYYGKKIIKIHYAAVRSDGLDYLNETKNVILKKFSARKLLNIIGKYK